MVVVKRLDPKYPRMGYEVQKGLVIDLPRGDGKADIVKGEDGSLTLSEADGHYQVTLKDVHLSDFVEHNVRVKLKRGLEENHLTLDNLVINSPTSTVISYEGNNVISGSILSGHNVVEMTGQEITDSFIKDSQLDRAELKDSSIKRSLVHTGFVEDSEVVNSNVDGAVITKDSTVELSELMGDTVTAATVGGVRSGWDGHSWEFDERAFTDGYFVGNGKHAGQHDFDHGYTQVVDEDAYVDGLATLALNRDLPYGFKGYDYRPSEALKERLEDELVFEDYRDETLDAVPFFAGVYGLAGVEQSVVDEEIARDIEKSIAEDTARREADDFVIDESQFDVTLQQGLQQ